MIPTPREIRAGIGAEVLDWLEQWLNVDAGELNHILRISRTTRQRRSAAGILNCGESDRVASILRVICETLEYFDGNVELRGGGWCIRHRRLEVRRRFDAVTLVSGLSRL